MEKLNGNLLERNKRLTTSIGVILLVFFALPVFSQAPNLQNVETQMDNSMQTVVAVAKWIMRAAALLGLGFLIWTGLVDDDGARKLKPYIIRYVVVLVVWAIFEGAGIVSTN